MSSEIDRIVDITISRNTTVPTEESFDNVMIAAEFLTTDVTPVYTGRIRSYSTIAEIGTAFGTTHPVYAIAAAIKSQNPSISLFYVGRKLTGGEGSETWTQALTNINAEDSGWYGLVVDERTLSDQQLVADWAELNNKLCGLSSDDQNILDSTGDIAEYIQTNDYDRSFVIFDRESSDQNSATIVYDADFVTSNSNTTTINGTAVGPVVFATTHDAMMTAIVAAINADVTLDGIVASLDSSDTNNRTINLYFQQTGIATCTSVTTLGASQPAATITFSTTDEWPDAAWIGRMFPKDPGKATWKFKTLTGVVSNGSISTKPFLTTSELNTLFGKNGNAYNLVSGVNITENGTVGSGEYIDVIRGVDWLQARIQTLVFTPLVQLDKVPFTNAGIQIVVSQLKFALDEAVDIGLITEDYDVDYPDVDDVSDTDKAARLLPDVEFTATLAGAIHKTEINGVVSL
jgi:hypothetical protein